MRESREGQVRSSSSSFWRRSVERLFRKVRLVRIFVGFGMDLRTDRISRICVETDLRSDLRGRATGQSWFLSAMG